MAAHCGKTGGRRSFTPLLIFLVLILLGFWLRVHNLDAFSFWTDEGLTPERSGYPIAQILRNEILIQGFVTRDTHPPLYYLIIHVTRSLFGVSDFAFRYPSVLFGVLFPPLIFQLGRRMGGHVVGWIATILATVNPLLVYYSQEARMYTLLTLLVTGMSYVLWEQLQIGNYELRIRNYEWGVEGGERRHDRHPATIIIRRLLLYCLLAALAVYTHYTSVFIVATQALFWGWILWRNGLKRFILAGVVLIGLIAIPLLPYTVPRLLSGAEANYYDVAPLTMLLDIVRFFNLGLTVDFSQPLIIGLNLLAFALLLLGVWVSAGYAPRIMRPTFLLVWLLAPALGLMIGGILFKPMYQGVRHIMAASPAFLLLLAFGLSWGNRSRFMAARPTQGRRRLISAVLLLILLVGAALSLSNLYSNPAYVKDDFRSIVRFIETRAGDRDVVVYNNAVLLPLHEHYRLRADLPVTALPVYPQVATGQEPELTALADDYDRIWFITDPPADGRDDAQLIRGWLDEQQTVVINQLFPARTTEARVITYLTGSGAPSSGLPVSGEASCSPSSQTPCVPSSLPELIGVMVDSRLALPTLWVDLLWQGERPQGETALRFTLIGADGVERYREVRPLLPTRHTGWSETAAVRLSYDLPLPPGMPPGEYSLKVVPEASPVNDSEITLGRVEIAPTSAWPASPNALFVGTLPAPERAAVRWSSGLELAAVVPWDEVVLPGNNLPVTLYWRAGPDGADLSNLHYRLEVIDSHGRVIREQGGKPGAPWLGQIDAGALLREDTGLYIRPDDAPGSYRLRWTLFDGDVPIGRPRIHGRITVQPWQMETVVPQVDHEIGASFGETIRLHGFDMGPRISEQQQLTLYWQAIAPPADYTVFIHLVNEAGVIVSQIDSVPMGGARPTSGWRVGEVITDKYVLPIPEHLPPGRYGLYLGLYDPEGGARLTVTIDDITQPDNQLRLATLDLPGNGGEP